MSSLSNRRNVRGHPTVPTSFGPVCNGLNFYDVETAETDVG